VDPCERGNETPGLLSAGNLRVVTVTNKSTQFYENVLKPLRATQKKPSKIFRGEGHRM
jgi:hypothetical protein